MKIAYIAETSLTNKSAYTVHVLKMCNALSKNNHVSLLIPFSKNLNFKKLRKKFMLNSKNKFFIHSILNSKINNFINRFFFAFKVTNFSNLNKYDLILTRSVMTSFFLTLFKISHFLEVHSEFRGLTKFLMISLNFINSKYIKKIIFISKALKKKFNIQKKNTILILHDAVDVNNFKPKINNFKIKNITYVGSFHEGKGVELILKLADRFKDYRFNIYGEPLKIKYIKPKNLNIYGYINYNEVPNKLANSDILLLPSSKKQYGRSKSVNIANYNSPLKMFDYLASGKIIISSKLDGINEVLKHNYNAIITDGFNVESWEDSLKSVLTHKFNLNKIRKNAIKTAKEFTWEKRSEKMIDSYLALKNN